MLKKSSPYFIVLTVFFVLFSLYYVKSDAAEFSKALLRLNRLKANTATAGLVCAQPATNSTEASVEITFPSDFSVNSNSSNWTVSTSNIPADAVAWTGIGTASNVSGQTVSFPSGNLALGNFYCFNFSLTNTLITGSAGDKTGTITTKTSGGLTIDGSTYGLSIKSSDQISVTAAVAANPTDFEAQTSLSNAGTTFPQDAILNYTITYGSNLSYATNIEVEAQWSLGTISGSATPTVEVVNYVVGSASDGYNSTPAVVDTVDRTISWTINSFPANQTGETVTFQLKTTSSYTGSNEVDFDVTGRVLGPGTQTPDSTLTNTYLHNFGITPTPAPTSTPGPGSTSATTSTPTPTVAQAPFFFNNIAINTLSNNSASINITTNQSARHVLNYGTSISALTKSVSGLGLSASQTISLGELTAGTQYFFIVRATNASGEVIDSDVFTFETALTSANVPLIRANSIVITSQNKVLFSPGLNEIFVELEDETSSEMVVVLPTKQPYEFSFSLDNAGNVERITAYIVNESVLGINNLGTQELAENNIEIFEILPGVYSGRFITKPSPGTYQIYARIYDYDGNISEQKLTKIKVVRPFTVLTQNSKKPVENAAVTLYIYNPKTKLFVLIQPEIIPIDNPSFTEPDGTIKYALPNARYLAKIVSIGFKDKEVEFTIGGNPGEEFPEVLLEREPFNLLTQLRYYLSTLMDVFHALNEFAGRLSTSIRFFDLIAMSTLAFLVITTIFSLSVRTHIPIFKLPLFFIFYTLSLLRIKHNDHIAGIVKDANTGRGLPRVKVQFYNQDTGKLVSSSTTNTFGEFVVKRQGDVKIYKMEMETSGYHGMTVKDYGNGAVYMKLEFALNPKGEELRSSLKGMFISGAENLFSFAFEFLLLNCLVFEIIFISTIGIAKTLPFLLLTVLTIIMWLFYARRVVRRYLTPSY